VISTRPPGAPEFTPGFNEVRVTRSLVLYVCFVDRLFVLFILVIVLSVLLRYTDSDYLPLVSSNSSMISTREITPTTKVIPENKHDVSIVPGEQHT
jgi:hypothetical protein